MRIGVVVFGLLVLLNACVAPGPSGRFAAAGGSEPHIRVLLDEGKREIVLQAQKGFTIQTSGGLVILEAPAGSTARITSRYPSLNVTVTPGNAVSALEGEAVIVPRKNSGLSYGNIPYEGVMKVTIDNSGGLSLLNVLPLEAYLKGVFHWEKLTEADLDAAFSNFELALEKDPNYAPAYVGRDPKPLSLHGVRRAVRKSRDRVFGRDTTSKTEDSPFVGVIEP